jgi:hypothetical protein
MWTDTAWGVAGLDAGGRYVRLTKRGMQPLRQRTGVDPGEFDNAGRVHPEPCSATVPRLSRSTAQIAFVATIKRPKGSLRG